MILNAELRVPVWREFGAVFFADGGNVFKRATDFDLASCAARSASACAIVARSGRSGSTSASSSIGVSLAAAWSRGRHGTSASDRRSDPESDWRWPDASRPARFRCLNESTVDERVTGVMTGGFASVAVLVALLLAVPARGRHRSHPGGRRPRADHAVGRRRGAAAGAGPAARDRRGLRASALDALIARQLELAKPIAISRRNRRSPASTRVSRRSAGAFRRPRSRSSKRSAQSGFGRSSEPATARRPENRCLPAPALQLGPAAIRAGAAGYYQAHQPRVHDRGVECGRSPTCATTSAPSSPQRSGRRWSRNGSKGCGGVPRSPISTSGISERGGFWLRAPGFRL